MDDFWQKLLLAVHCFFAVLLFLGDRLDVYISGMVGIATAVVATKLNSFLVEYLMDRCGRKNFKVHMAALFMGGAVAALLGAGGGYVGSMYVLDSTLK
jgi:uncharacterized membrane protein YjjP (DUF1212 family)